MNRISINTINCIVWLPILAMLFSACNTGAKRGQDMSEKDIQYIRTLGLLDKDENIILFDAQGATIWYGIKEGGSFFSDKRIAGYWIAQYKQQKTTIDYAFYKDIDSITLKDRSTALTDASYLTVYKHDGTKFRAYIDGNRQKVKDFYKSALEEWKKQKALRLVVSTNLVSRAKRREISTGHMMMGGKVDTTIYGNQLIYPFKDTSYKLLYTVLKDESDDENEKNAVLSYVHTNGKKSSLIFRDSLYSRGNFIGFKDMNNDSVRDIMVFYNTGGRANPTYHLYLRDTIHHKITYVKGFEDLPNPNLDTTNNLIASYALSGQSIGYGFYRINNHNKLLNLWHLVDAPMDDSVKYEQAVKAILKKWGK